ncbi:MAG TPA: AraC family transcriptional regulator [Blastocatellia bacterium]|nr:AraC family transcriptional regulator [Blastocatellia bacterium]
MNPTDVFKITKRLDVSGLIMTEAVSKDECLIPPHSHDQTHITIVIEGFCEEIYNGKKRDIPPLAVSYFHPGEIHSLRVFNTPTRSFDIEIGQEWFDRLPNPIKPITMIDPPQGPVSGLMIRLYREFKETDDLSALAIQALTLELLVELARTSKGARVKKAPLWLHNVVDLINNKYKHNITLSEMAESADVNPSHLIQVFREHFHCTPGEFLRRVRVEWAMRQLRNPALALSDISSDVGFSDQSHFTRVFKRFTGLTPAQYRSLNINPDSVQNTGKSSKTPLLK